MMAPAAPMAMTASPPVKHSIMEIAERSKSPVDFVLWMQSEGYVSADNRMCPPCSVKMQLHEKPHGIDYVQLMCPSCKHVQSVRTGSFFEHHKIPMAKSLALARCFEEGISVAAACNIVGVSDTCVRDHYEQLHKLEMEAPHQDKKVRRDFKMMVAHPHTGTNLLNCLRLGEF